MGITPGPDWGILLSEWWTSSYGSSVLANYAGFASNLVFGSNPPYTAVDFLSFYPKFGGTPTTITGILTAGSQTVTSVSLFTGLAVGQLVSGQGIQSGATITAFDSSAETITLSAAATTTGTVQSMSVYIAPFLPLFALNLYISLANASLQQARWQEQWPLAMALYVAHFATLWMRSEGDAYSTPGQAAAAGLERGLLASKAVGDVSVSSEFVAGEAFAGWGAWLETTYGLQLASIAKTIGWGLMYVR